jgi:antitoxin MazE
MLARIRRWGNSLAVRLPKSLSSELGLADGSTVDLALDQGSIRLVPVTTRRQELSAKLEAVTFDNLHDDSGFGDPLENEMS